ncbi:MAG: hypothetical protein AB200_00440 [Parcubacteria bacterium C7867-005]|nr:MAG: hypothetical protein AB200_00440 [Parcubacteria bacterium C7867-005]
MGSLVSETPFSEVSATMELLAKHGVEREDLVFFRRYHNGFAPSVANMIKSGRMLFAQAMGPNEEAGLSAVAQIVDRRILYDIAMYPDSLTSVRIAAVGKLPQSELYDVARITWEAEVAEAAMLHLDAGYLSMLWGCDSIGAGLNRGVIHRRWEELENQRLQKGRR